MDTTVKHQRVNTIENFLDSDKFKNVGAPSFWTPGVSRNPSEVPTPRNITPEDTSKSVLSDGVIVD